MNVIIAGTRTFDDHRRLVKVCDKILNKYKRVVVLSGCAKGADMLGEKYAVETGRKVLKFPADWDKHGKKAGYIRNKEMANVGDVLIAFWDGESSGTANIIELARKQGLAVFLHIYPSNVTLVGESCTCNYCGAINDKTSVAQKCVKCDTPYHASTFYCLNPNYCDKQDNKHNCTSKRGCNFKDYE